MGVPLIITDYVPGQEIGNVEWVQRHNVGLYEPSTQGIARVVADLLRPGNPELARMAERALATARPDAAHKIADAALGLLQM